MSEPETEVCLQGDGVRLVASAWGDSEAPPICFFHGGGQSRRSWAAAARSVARRGYYGLSVDLRGHGDSDWAMDGDYLLDAYGRDVERLVDQFDRPVALVGASRGGQAALVGGSRRQDRVRLVMLADVAPLIDEQGVEAIRGFLQASLTGFPDLEAAANALASYLGQPRVADASGLARSMRVRDGRLFWHWDPRTVSPEFLNPPSESVAMTDAARAFRRPLVLVRAEHGSLVTDASVNAFRKLSPQLVVEQAVGTHHMFTADRNTAFAARLLHHLETTAAPAEDQA